MDKINILLVEDDMIIATHIASVLAEAGYNITGIAVDAVSAMSLLTDPPPDLAILDISIKGEVDGIELAKKIREQLSIPIIFLTANSDESTYQRAKHVYPDAFIPKPFNATQLVRTVELAILKFAQEDGEPAQTQQPVFLQDRIFVRSKDRLVKVLFEDIQYIKAERNYCQIVTDDKKFLLSVPLKKMASKLNSNEFIRVHRSYLVNILQIDELDDHNLFFGKEIIPVSKSFRSLLIQKLNMI